MTSNRMPGLDFGLGETADMIRSSVESFAPGVGSRSFISAPSNTNLNSFGPFWSAAWNSQPWIKSSAASIASDFVA